MHTKKLYKSIRIWNKKSQKFIDSAYAIMQIKKIS